MTLRYVARHADARTLFGPPDEVRRTFAIPRQQWETEGRDYNTIERTNLISLLLARDEADLAAKRQRLATGGPFAGFAGTTAQAADLIGQYQEAGTQMFISSAYRNDPETLELLASGIMPHFL